MHLFSTLTAFAALATVTIAQDPKFYLQVNFPMTPGLANDVGDFYTNDVSFANGSLFIGQVSLQTASEPFIANYGNRGIFFTSYHQTPTGSVALYLFPNITAPVGLTIPHGGYTTQPGATISGFGFSEDGYLTFGGQNNFIGCLDSVANSYQIYWLGNKTDLGDPKVDCVGPLYLYRTNITLHEGITFRE